LLRLSAARRDQYRRAGPQELDRFDNPGKLRGLFIHGPRSVRPRRAAAGRPARLHQNAGGYDQGAGWSRLADRHGFRLALPGAEAGEITRTCGFNWYQRSDASRGGGEAASIANMVSVMKARLPIDGDRVFVTGLSAGGAMTSVMLATYPELFAGGAIIAGLPYGCADNVSEAFEAMAGRGFGSDAGLANAVRAASPHMWPWPRVSIWHGSADRIVVPANADALVKQWTGLHGLAAKPHRVEQVDGHRRQVWLGREGQELVENITVAGMAHGTPLMPGTGEGQSGEAQAHMLDVGLSSTDRIAAFFGIGPEVKARLAGARAAGPKARPRSENGARPSPSAASGPVAGVQKTIEDALRSAGLMR
jgi:poly(hydroxyalkanoate) depolymerase family esterase